MQEVSCPSRQHFQHLDGKTTGLARRVCGRDGVVDGLLADLLSRRAALPRWIRAISQDRDRGRCDHDPILVEMVEKFMCGIFFFQIKRGEPTVKRDVRRFKAFARDRKAKKKQNSV